ncbi:zf-CCHC domain-containing protein [Tanacetum coccineum]
MSTQQDINVFRTQRIANTHDPLALMSNTQTPCHPDHSSLITYIQHPQPSFNFVPQPSFNTNYMPQPMQNLEDSSDPTTAMNKALALLAKAFKVNTIPTNNNQRSSLIPRNSQTAQQDMNTSQDIKMQMVDDNVGNQVRQNVVQYDANEVGQNAVHNPAPAEGNGNGINGNPIRCYNCRGEGHYASNCTVKPRKRDAAYLQQQLQIAQEEEAGIQSTQVECEFMAAADAYKETERVKVNCTLEDTLQQASLSGTQSDNAPVYDSDGLTKVEVKTDRCKMVELNGGDQFKTYAQAEILGIKMGIMQYRKSGKSDLDEIEKYNANCILMANFACKHRPQEAAKFVRDFKSLAKEAGESLAKHKDIELEIEPYSLRAVVQSKTLCLLCKIHRL